MSQNGERSTPSEEVEGASRDTASPDPLQAGHQPEPSLSPANAGTAGVPSTDLTTQQTQSSMDTAEADVGPNQITNGTAQSTNATMTNGTSKDTGTEDQRHENAVDGDTPMEDQTSTSKDALEDYDWQELENRFAGKMMECQRKEQELAKEFAEWVEVFRAWASVTEVHEEERASKRLRTRMTYVQQKEQGLEEKRQHYVKVVNAFESALALLADA